MLLLTEVGLNYGAQYLREGTLIKSVLGEDLGFQLCGDFLQIIKSSLY